MRIKSVKKSASEYADISFRIREIRLDARMTQKEMGKLVGLTAASIGAIENGLYTPNFKVLRIIHKKLNVPYEYIIDGTKGPERDLLKENTELKKENDRLKKVIDKLT